MPSKDYNGQNPLGGKRIQPSAGLGASGAFAQVELQVGRLQPAISLQSGSLQTPNGRIPSQKVPPAGTTVPCQLGKMLFDSENSTTLLPKFKLLPGFLTGGGGTELIEPDNLAATIGDFVWLEVNWTCDEIDGVQQAGGTLGAVTVAQGATIPTDTVPTSAGAATAIIVLGGWISNGATPPGALWVNQGCGSIQVFFCPGGGFFHGRSNVVEAPEV
jgi:hypothetical protein